MPWLTAGSNGGGRETRRAPEFLTTRAMAQQLGVSVKTIRRRKAKGEMRPALVMGKRLIRWKGVEAKTA